LLQKKPMSNKVCRTE